MIINTTVDTPVYRLEEARYLAVVGGDGGVVHTHTHTQEAMDANDGCWLLAPGWRLALLLSKPAYRLFLSVYK